MFIFDKYDSINAQTYHSVKIMIVVNLLKISLWYDFNKWI